MSKVTSKLQVTVPKAIAEQFGIRPGDEIEWIPAGDTIRVVPAARKPLDVAERLRLFHEATARQKKRNRRWKGEREPASRGWTREDLYEERSSRGGPR